MNESRESMLLLVSLPIYFVIIGAEMLYSSVKRRSLYSTKGVLVNLYLTSLNMGLDFLVRGVCLFVLDYGYRYRLADLSASPILYWIALIVFEDFMYYWLHRVDHRCRFFWAVHVTHHSSEEFNLTVGFRSSVFQPLYRFLYFVPLSLCGFKSIDILFAYGATQIFGILVHTQTVGTLGFLEHLLVTPTHHRVHHGINRMYRDRNMGMLLIVWDRLFGTFQAEDAGEPVHYGIGKMSACTPTSMLFHEWRDIVTDLRRTDTMKDKLMYVFGPPGWCHGASSTTADPTHCERESRFPD